MQSHPVLSTDYEQLREASSAVDEFVAELQSGIDNADAVTRRLLADRVAAPSSRYETVGVSAPAPGVAEMALYVLVRRDGRCWLAAGQNTMIRPKPA